MSLASFFRQHRPHLSDEGFTLMEVIAAIVVFGLVASMGLALLLASIRGGYVAKMDTVGRNLTQAKIEELRNLPYHIGQAASTEPDLLDLYYPNLTATATTGTTGYVSNTSSARSTSDGDPTTGAFYRTVIAAVPNYSQYKEYVTVQFVNNSGSAVTPQSTWSATTSGADTPVTNQVNVSVTTFWNVGTTAKKYNIFTEVSGGRPMTSKISIQGSVAALTVTGTLPGGAQGTLNLGNVDYNASFSNIVSAAATATAAEAEVEGGGKVVGAVASALAPPSSGPFSSTQNSGQSLQYSGSPFVSFAGSDATNISAGSASGQPYAGTSSSLLNTDLFSNGSGSNAATFSNQPSVSARLGLEPDKPIVQVVDASGGGSSPSINATAYGASSTSMTSHSATSNISGLTTSWIELFPTSWAPAGLVQLYVQAASLTCTTSAPFGGSSTGSTALTYNVQMRVGTWNGSGVTYPDTWTTLTQTNQTDPLPAPSSIQVGFDSSTGTKVYLSEYIASWSSLTSGQVGVPPAVQASTDGKSVSADYNGLLTINTQPLRSGDATSTVGITVGAMSCQAVDYR